MIPAFAHDLAFLWGIAFVLGALLLALAGLGAHLQYTRTRHQRRRIQWHERWERDIVGWLFQEGDLPESFQHLGPQDRSTLIAFLLRVLGIIGGPERGRILALYHQLGLTQGLETRLRSRKPRTRAIAALEVGSFQAPEHYPRLVELLEDPVPHVAHAAARSLALGAGMAQVEPVMAWILRQEFFQRDRILWILESFGPAVLDWLEARPADDRDPREQLLYLQLVSSLRYAPNPDRVFQALREGDLECQAAALRALGELLHPDGWEACLPFAESPQWVLRARAMKVLGILGGLQALGPLLRGLEDPVFEVRRNAADGLVHLGPAGRTALECVRTDPHSDPFARDLAEEVQQWREFRVSA